MYLAIGGAVLVGVYLLFKKGVPGISAVTDSVGQFGGKARGLIGSMTGDAPMLGKEESASMHGAMAARAIEKPATQASASDTVGTGASSAYTSKPQPGRAYGKGIMDKTSGSAKVAAKQARGVAIRAARKKTSMSRPKASPASRAAAAEIKSRAGRPSPRAGRAGSAARYQSGAGRSQRSHYVR